jgi:DNA-binding winged helix-turn-helix (wHTH) protein/tetratricopeptide (TPR) repeat protein
MFADKPLNPQGIGLTGARHACYHRAMRAAGSASIYTFGDFQLDCRSHELRKRGRALRIQRQAFDVLSLLVEAHGNVVTREALRDAMWAPDTHVDFDRGINKTVNRLRQLLGDRAARARFIETLPKSGYRFLAPVTHVSSRARVVSPDLREVLIKAKHFWKKRTPLDIARSVEYFRRAIEMDAECAAAWAGLAEAHVMTGILGLESPQQAFPAARAAAEKALMLDDGASEAHTALADVHKLYEWDWNRAERAYRRAIEVDPLYAGAHHWYAQLLAVLGRHDEAVNEIEAARRCDPVSVPINAFISYVWIEARDYRRAIEAALKASELDSSAPLPCFFLGRAFARLGEHRRAITALANAARLGGHAALFESSLGYAYARAEQRTKAARILDGWRSAQLGVIPAIDLALVCLGLGDTNGALNALEEACAARSPRMINLNDPFFSELSGEPRYQRLLERLCLPPGPCLPYAVAVRAE